MLRMSTRSAGIGLALGWALLSGMTQAQEPVVGEEPEVQQITTAEELRETLPICTYIAFIDERGAVDAALSFDTAEQLEALRAALAPLQDEAFMENPAEGTSVRLTMDNRKEIADLTEIAEWKLFVCELDPAKLPPAFQKFVADHFAAMSKVYSTSD